MTGLPAWWRHGDALPCFLADLATAELRRLRPTAPGLSPGPWPPRLPLEERGLDHLIDIYGASKTAGSAGVLPRTHPSICCPDGRETMTISAAATGA